MFEHAFLSEGDQCQPVHRDLRGWCWSGAETDEPFFGFGKYPLQRRSRRSAACSRCSCIRSCCWRRSSSTTRHPSQPRHAAGTSVVARNNASNRLELWEVPIINVRDPAIILLT